MRMNIRTSLYFWLENYRKIVDYYRKAVDKIVGRLSNAFLTCTTSIRQQYRAQD